MPPKKKGPGQIAKLREAKRAAKEAGEEEQETARLIKEAKNKKEEEARLEEEQRKLEEEREKLEQEAAKDHMTDSENLVRVSHIQGRLELRDIMTSVFSYLGNPSPFHRTCWFMLQCYEHSHYLESHHHCPHLISLQPGALLESKLRGEQKDQAVQRLSSLPLGRRIPVPIFDNFRGGFRVAPRDEHTAATSNGAGYKLNLAHLHDWVDVGIEVSSGIWIKQIRLGGCPNLKNLKGLKAPIGQISELQLEHLPQLKHLNVPLIARSIKVSNLTGLESIATPFGQPKTVEHFTMKDLPYLKAISKNFLAGCFKLTAFKVGDFPNLRAIGPQFMHTCPALKTFELTNLPELTAIDYSFLSYTMAGVTRQERESISQWTSLKKVTLRNLPKLQTIEEKFLYDSSQLAEFVFDEEQTPSLKSIGDYCLTNSGVSMVTLRGLQKLGDIGKSFCNRCPNLRKVVLTDLPMLREIEDGCWHHSQLLTSMELSGLPMLPSVFGIPNNKKGKMPPQNLIRLLTLSLPASCELKTEDRKSEVNEEKVNPKERVNKQLLEDAQERAAQSRGKSMKLQFNLVVV